MQALRTLFVCSLLFSFLRTSTTNTLDTMSPNQYIRHDQTLISAGGTFQLGFFSPGNVKGQYLGIWSPISKEIVVWVANRETPLDDSSGVLKVTDRGVIVLLNSSNGIVWSSNSSRTVDNPVSQLLDSGNLVVKDADETNPDNFLWQSFDYPCDTFLPEMKLGWDFVTGFERYVSSWKSTEDPARGEFSLRMTTHGLPQLVVMKGAKIQTRSGSWNGLRLTGSVSRPNPLSEFEFFLNKDEVYYEYRLLNKSMPSRYTLNPSGIALWLTWIENTHSWEPFFSTQQDQCEIYAFCGSYSSCNISNAPGVEEAVVISNSVKLEHFLDPAHNEEQILVLLPKNDIEKKSKLNKKTQAGIIGVSINFISATVHILLKRSPTVSVARRKDYLGEDREDMELPLYDLNTIVHATNGFSSRNKLGEGGNEIAVKRLSKDSGQGMREFKNEVILIAKLQHRNLVKLLGCCTQDDEKILIYEFMANRSLDFYIFDQERAKLLDWPKCFHIIDGIARGLLYLHQDSRLRIIHRDLKASNILLDDNMNPKISDFGLAKIFGGDQSRANTNRVVGTYSLDTMDPKYTTGTDR
ncbi:G-type lectin S-receptor-like serine/threonine-protein kinase [Prunus yedoensis var. nudiflora]|uniref:G-type lectin S-receptor-like serine/threonine-protein kinase n=1 Tax=Prunus yedoensis var. nudiflora TaxID=2094558 RepID=A0A314XM64_PRUYE|nr:G-type lectin S-receptor-like serine/threonine-protein kinase [Prunus yedoensis var. nudiflora]